MPVLIQLSQLSAPITPPGQSREDLVTGVPVAAEAIGGPFSQYVWSFRSKAIDIVGGVQSTCAFSAPSGPITDIDPIDVAGTYEIAVSVDSGSGLGATSDDVATIIFYAGDPASATMGPLSTDPSEIPQRMPAFSERLEANIPDIIEPTGNTQGWSRTWLKWFQVIINLFTLRLVAAVSVAGLRGKKSTTCQDGSLAHVLGGFIYEFDSTSVASDNGTTIVKPTDRTGAGRWLGILTGGSVGSTLSQLWVDGTTTVVSQDGSQGAPFATVQQACTAITARGYLQVIVYIVGGQSYADAYVIPNGLVSLEFEGLGSAPVLNGAMSYTTDTTAVQWSLVYRNVSQAGAVSITPGGARSTYLEISFPSVGFYNLWGTAGATFSGGATPLQATNVEFGNLVGAAQLIIGQIMGCKFSGTVAAVSYQSVRASEMTKSWTIANANPFDIGFRACIWNQNLSPVFTGPATSLVTDQSTERTFIANGGTLAGGATTTITDP